MDTLTAEQFKKKYGVIASSDFDQTQKQDDVFSQIKQAFNQGSSQVYEGVNQAMRPGEAAGNMPLGVLKAGAGVVNAATSPLAPVFAPIGKAINAIGDKVSDIPAVQDLAQSKAGEYAAKGAEGILNADTIAGALTGAKGLGEARAAVPAVTSKLSEAVPKVPPGGAKAALGETMTGISEKLPTSIGEAIGTKQSWINHNIARALDLTPGDLSNIAKSTGNEVGKWMADNNLIGSNKATTSGLTKNFFTDNYKSVRQAINKVDVLYKPTKVPYLTDSLKAIAAETQGKVGLEAINKELTGLLAKKELKLSDVQRVKELLDEHFSLYKVTGDVQSGVVRQGLANARQELKTFIENEVKANTGEDIRAMNNNVSTAKSLLNAIETRTPRGLTRAQLTWRDAAIGMGLTYFGSPLVGLAAVAIKKILTSPSVRLRFARYLDSLNDAQRLKISQSLKEGQVPADVQEIIGPVAGGVSSAE